MTSRGTSTKTAGRLTAGIDTYADRTSVVVVRAAGAGSTLGAVQVVEARSFAAADKAGVAAMCERLRVSLVVRAAPADACTARAATIPTGEAAGMLAAAALLAESEVPADVPAHRRAGGLLPARPGASVRDALLTGWMRAETPARLTDKVDECWTTPMACLAALRGGNPLAVLCRPHQNASCILASGDAGTVARVLIEDADDTGAWQQSVDQGIADACDAANVSAAITDVHDGFSIAGGMDDLRARALGARVDDEWLKLHAVALGAAMAGLDCPPGLAPLASLHAVAPKERVPAPIRFASWISRPSVAWPIGAAAALVLLAGPWALAHQRASVATGKAAQLDDAKSQTKDLGLRAAAYEQLEVARWPMTKVLADVAGAAPVGITIEDARVSTEQGVTLRGVAKSRELVNELEKNLGATRVFRNIKQNRNESKPGGGAEFDLSAQVDVYQVHAPVKPVKDFATKSLAVELYGDGASNTTIPVGAKRQAPVGSRASSRFSSPSSDTVDTNRRTTTASSEVPPAVTDADINAMDVGAAMKGWTTRKNFLQRNAGIDPTIKARLEDEITKMKERQRKASEGGNKK